MSEIPYTPSQMDDFKERLTTFIAEHLEVSVRQFELNCGITNGTVGSIKAQGPTASVISKISETYPELNLNWLFRGVGPMVIEEAPKTSPSVSIGSIQTVNIGNWDELVKLLAHK